MEDKLEKDSEAKKTKSYGSRSKKQLFLIYLVIAIVVYFAIYWFFIRKSGDSGGGLY